MGEKRCYTVVDMVDMGFCRRLYSFPEEPGAKFATLVMKEWGKNINVICYFDTDDGQKIMLSAYRDGKKGEIYTPKESAIDMSYAPLGSRWKIQYTLDKKNRTKWLVAEPIE